MGTTSNKNQKNKRNSAHHYELESKPTKVDTLLESADLLVTTAQNVSELANIPILSTAAQLVSSILEIVQEVRDNKSAFQQLATEAFRQVQSLTELIEALLKEEGKIGHKRMQNRLNLLGKDIDNLVLTLTKIDEFTQAKLKRNIFQRVLYWRYDIQTIRQYRDEMTKAGEIYSQRSQTVLRFDMANVDRKTDKILEHLKKQEQERRDAEASAASASASPAPPTPPAQSPPFQPQQQQSQSQSPPPMSPFDFFRDDPYFPFPPKKRRSTHHPGASFSPPSSAGGGSFVNMVNVGNTSTTTHNGNVINYGGASPPPMQQQQQQQQHRAASMGMGMGGMMGSNNPFLSHGKGVPAGGEWNQQGY